MEYEFINDPITGLARANFSLEHEVFGPWLEVEIGNDANKMSELLSAIDSVVSKKVHELLIVGSEYNVLISNDDVIIKTNASENDELPDSLGGEELDFDQNHQGSCGLDDFELLLDSWSKFI